MVWETSPLRTKIDSRRSYGDGGEDVANAVLTSSADLVGPGLTTNTALRGPRLKLQPTNFYKYRYINTAAIKNRTKRPFILFHRKVKLPNALYWTDKT